MKEYKKYYDEVVRWNEAHGIEVTLQAQRDICNEVWAEYHEHEKMTTAKLLELADVFFVTAYLSYLVGRTEENYHTSYISAMQLVYQHGAEKYLDAVIKSNWSKYMPVKRYSLESASIEAVKASKKYEGRYTAIVPKLTTCGGFFFLQGITKDGDPKVIKQSCYISAEKFLS